MRRVLNVALRFSHREVRKDKDIHRKKKVTGKGQKNAKQHKRK